MHLGEIEADAAEVGDEVVTNGVLEAGVATNGVEREGAILEINVKTMATLSQCHFL